MTDERYFEGIRHIKVTGGDAADVSWEVTMMRGMGLNPRSRQDEEDHFVIYLTPKEAEAYHRESEERERAYLSSPEGIQDQKMEGHFMRDYLRSPEGRLMKHEERVWKRTRGY